MAGIMGRGRKRKCRNPDCRRPFAPVMRRQTYCSRWCYLGDPDHPTNNQSRYHNDPVMRENNKRNSRRIWKERGPEILQNMARKKICRAVYNAKDDDDSLFHDPKFIKDLTGVTCPIREAEMDG